MYISTSALLALLSAPLLALAQSNPNAFIIPSGGLSAKGGQALALKWTPSTQGTISLILRSGKSDNLAEGTIIASGISNSGSYTWTPSNSLTSGSQYTIEIVSDENPDETNYTPYFDLDTPTTATHATSTVTLGAPSSAIAVTPSPPISSVDHHTKSGKASTATTAASSDVTSEIANTFTHPHVSGTKTSRSGASTAASSTGSTMATSASGSSTSGSATPAASSTSNGAAARASAVVGLLGVVALGALAL